MARDIYTILDGSKYNYYEACEPNNASGNTALKTGVGCLETPIQHPALFNGVYSVDN